MLSGCAKITRPKAAHLTERPRLFAALDHARRGSATWISAPPGFGKTSLANSYIEYRGLDCVWYRVDEDDADPSHFFYYLNQAFQSLPHHDDDPSARTTDEHAAYARRCFERWCLRLHAPTLLVFDDYQRVPATAPLHGWLAHAAEHLPEGIHLLILSRESPPPAYARLCVHGALARIDADALAFTPAEAHTLVARAADLTIAQEKIPGLIERASGWVAGLALLVECERAATRDPAKPRSTEPSVVFDYFAGEVFQQLDAAQRNVIVQAAWLPTMDARAVCELLGDERAADILANLAQRNYFTQVLVQREASVYRFHPLFRAFLLYQARHAFSTARLADLQQRAARVLEDHGQVEDAITLLCQASDWNGAARLIVARAPALVMNGRLHRLETWLNELPGPLLDRSPWLLYWLSQCCLGCDPVAARACAMRAYALFDTTDDAAGLYLAWATVTTSLLMEGADFKSLDAEFATLNTLQHRHPVMPTVGIEADVTCAVLGASLSRAEQVDVNGWRDRAMRILHGRANDQPTQRILLCVHLLTDATLTASVGVADALADKLRSLVASPHAAPVQCILGYAALGTVAYQRGAHAEWRAAITAARTLAAESALSHADSAVFHAAVYGALMANDVAAAAAWVREMAGVNGLADVAIYPHCAALVALHQGDLETAQRYSQQSLESAVAQGADASQIFCRICTAQILFARGSATAALEHLHHAQRIATRRGWRIFAAVCALSEAQFALALGHTAQGLEHLRQALAMSRRAGGRMFPFWPRATLVKLLSTALRHDIEVAHVQSLVLRLNLGTDAPPVDVEHWPWAVKIYTLDGFTVVLRDGQPLSFTGKTQKRPLDLLKALLAHGGRDVGVRTLIDALWGEADGDAGQGAFDSALHRLRKLLGRVEGDGALVLQNGRLTLSAQQVWVDFWAFKHTLGQCAATAAVTDEAHFEELTRKVFALYRAPFLGDIDTPWVAPQRERLHSHFLQHILRAGNHYEQAQRWQDAARLYERALSIDHLSEALYRRLMTAYRHLGRRADALMVYRRCERALTATFDAPPSREIQSLHDRLRAEQ